MTRVTLLSIAVGGLLAAGACNKKSENPPPGPASGATAASGETPPPAAPPDAAPAPDAAAAAAGSAVDVPTEVDFEAEAAKKITDKNVEAQVKAIESELEPTK